MKHLHDHAIAPRNLKHVAAPFIIHLQVFGELFGSNTWLVNRKENILRTKDPYSDIVVVNFGMCIPWTTFSLGIGLVCVSFDLVVPGTSIPLGNISRRRRKFWIISLQKYSAKKGAASLSISGQ